MTCFFECEMNHATPHTVLPPFSPELVEQYFTITDQYVEVGDGFMIVYDVTMPETFEEVLRIREKITIVKEDPDVPILLVANKVDLEDDRAVTTEAGEELAERFGTMYIETSAYTRQVCS